MALNARDLWIILRARDEASRVLRSFNSNLRDLDNESARIAQRQVARGQSLMLAGGAIAAMGIAGVAALNDMTNAAIAYNQEAAKALTQTDGVKTSLDELKDIGKGVAREIPVAFEQVQGGLYDIFSSMDVNIPQAKLLLKEFARAAVAGQTDLQTASRGTIAILNAWKLEAKDVQRVNDIMFQLVRKGVGTYDEFAKSIGRAIPAAVRANQSFETLAGMMAFLTRNGLSTSMAATSAARALEALVNPKTVGRMEEMGIKVRDANGEFLPMVEILGQLNGEFSTMTSPDRAAALHNLFLGAGGTIQARRFFDTVFNNFGEFEQRVQEMINSAGALDEAYDIMFAQPQSKIQMLTNKYEIMRTEVGDKLLPIKMKLVEVLGDLLDKWDSMSPVMQNFIVYGAAITSALMVLVGAITMVAGASLIMTARVGGMSAAMVATSAAAGRAVGALMAFSGPIALVAVLVGGLKVLDTALRKDVTLGSNEARKAVEKFAMDGKSNLNEFFTSWGSGLPAIKNSLKDVKDVDSALDALFNRSKWQTFNDTMNSPFITTAWDEVNSKFKEIDTTLAGMVQDGSVTEAEMAFADIAARAKEQGIEIERLVEIFPQYGDAIAGIKDEQALAENMISEYSNLIDDNSDSVEDNIKAIQEWLEMVAESTASFISLNGAFESMIETNEALAKAAAEATEDTEDSWEDFIGNFPATVTQYIAELQKMVDAQTDWKENMLVLSGRVSQGMLDELAKLGPEGAPLVAMLRTASDEELLKIEELYGHSGADSVNNYASELAKAGPVFAALMSVAGVDAVNAAAAQIASGGATLQDIINRYGLTAHVSANTDSANHAVNQLISKITTTRKMPIEVYSTGSNTTPYIKGYANGGFVTGPGTRSSDDIAAMLSNGEYVVRADAVGKYGVSFLNAVNALRLNSGGLVSGRHNVNRPSYESDTPVVYGSPGTGFAVEKHVNINFEPGSVVTQEIDPMVHAEQLGFQIASKVR